MPAPDPCNDRQTIPPSKSNLAPLESYSIPPLRGPERLISQLQRVIQPPSTYPKIASIADVHGNLSGLNKELAICRKLGADRVIATGDFMDRDPHGLKVMEVVQREKESGFLVPLMGNHDLLFILAVFGSRYHLDLWLVNGGLSVLEERGGELAEIAKKISASAQQLVHQNKARSFRRAVSQLTESHDYFFNDCKGALEEDAYLQSCAEWSAQRLCLFEISEFGTLYIHAGIPTSIMGAPILRYPRDDERSSGLLALARIDADLHQALKDRDLTAPVVRFLHSEESPLWVRKWYEPLMHQEDASRFVDTLGITSIITGHTVVPKIENYGDGRIILADGGLAQSYLNQKAVVVVHPEGIDCRMTRLTKILRRGKDELPEILQRLNAVRPRAEQGLREAERLFHGH